MTTLTRRALMAGSAATAALGTFVTPSNLKATEWANSRWPIVTDVTPPSPTLADLAQMRDLARQAEEAYAVYDRIADLELDGEAAAFHRFMDIEHQMRMVPAQSVEGLLFKVRHLMADALWPDVESWLAEPLTLIADDLARIGGAS